MSDNRDNQNPRVNSGSIKNKFVLVLNANWQPSSVITVQRALVSVYDNANFLILQINHVENQEYPNLQPVSWKEWVEQEIPKDSDTIKTVRGEIRTPTVIIARNYRKQFLKKWAINLKNVYARDGGKCGYTGRKLKYKEASIDHIHPRSKGGKHSWSNVVLADKRVNNRKKDLTLDEFGANLLVDPKEPNFLPLYNLGERHPDWDYFFKK